MDTIFERIILILLCGMAIVLPQFTGQTEQVLAVFAVIIFSSFAMYFEKRMISLLICAAFFLLCVVLGDPYSLFFPCVIFELAYKHSDANERHIIVNQQLIYAAFGVAAFAVLASGMPQERIIYELVLCAAAIYLGFRCKVRKQKDRELLIMKDNKRELELLMTQKQENYIKQQEYEVRVATLNERNRIAREIHDNVGHVLSRSLLMVGALSACNKDEALAEHIKGIKDTLTGAMDSIRTSVHDLHEESIDLEDNLQLIIKDFTFCPVSLDFDMGRSVDKDIKYCILSIIKEALSNIAKHSNATKAVIVLREHEKLYQLLIDDNGTVKSEHDRRGMGLESMQERVSAFGGTVYFKTQNGFRIFVTIPKK